MEFKALGERIKHERLSKGLTQLQLSQITGIPNSTISNVECGHRIARIEQIIEIAKALGVNVSDLVELKEEERSCLFSSNLKLLRIANGWSQKELAERARLAVEQVSRFENGTVAGDAVLLKLANVMFVRGEDLMYADDIDLVGAVFGRMMREDGLDVRDADSVRRAAEIFELAMEINGK